MVALCHQPGKNVTSVARELGLTETAVRPWLNQAEVDVGQRPGVTSAEAEEIAKLGKQFRDVTEERDILARAVRIWEVWRVVRNFAQSC